MGTKRMAIMAAVAGLAFAPAAMADVELVSFTYSDLDGDFTVGGADSGTFTANERTMTQGDVTRTTVAPTGSAALDFGDAGIGTADFTMTIGVTNITDTEADGSGTITFSDVDGDVLTAMIFGTWSELGGSANFIGLISDAAFAGGDGSFLGTDGGSFSTTFPFDPPYYGNVISLTFGEWFTDGAGTLGAFSDVTTLASGAIAVPAPGAALLGMIGFSAAGRIRRKFA